MKRRLAALMRTAASVLRLRDQHGRPALILHPCFTQRSATADRTGAPRSQVQSGRRRRMRPGHAPWRIAATVITGMLAGGALASSASASTDTADVSGHRHPERSDHPERRGVLERDRCSNDPPRVPVPSAGLTLHGLHSGSGLRRGHEDRRALRPLPRVRVTGRRERRERVDRRGRGSRGIHDADLVVPGLSGDRTDRTVHEVLRLHQRARRRRGPEQSKMGSKLVRPPLRPDRRPDG